MSEDWREETLIEGVDGGRITRVIVKSKWGSWWTERKIIAVPSKGEPRQIHSDRWHTDWRLQVLPRLEERVDKFRIAQNRRDVPINIVNEGKPAVTSYMFAVHGWDFPELEEILGLTENTIRQYIIAVKNHSR